MRQCPTLEGDERPLITHMIGGGLCLSRQRGYYHKCHRCLYRGKPADFTLQTVGPPQPGVNGAPSLRTGRVDLPETRLGSKPQP